MGRGKGKEEEVSGERRRRGKGWKGGRGGEGRWKKGGRRKRNEGGE